MNKLKTIMTFTLISTISITSAITVKAEENPEIINSSTETISDLSVNINDNTLELLDTDNEIVYKEEINDKTSFIYQTQENKTSEIEDIESYEEGRGIDEQLIKTTTDITTSYNVELTPAVYETKEITIIDKEAYDEIIEYNPLVSDQTSYQIKNIYLNHSITDSTHHDSKKNTYKHINVEADLSYSINNYNYSYNLETGILTVSDNKNTKTTKVSTNPITFYVNGERQTQSGNWCTQSGATTQREYEIHGEWNKEDVVTVEFSFPLGNQMVTASINTSYFDIYNVCPGKGGDSGLDIDLSNIMIDYVQQDTETISSAYKETIHHEEESHTEQVNTLISNPSTNITKTIDTTITNIYGIKKTQNRSAAKEDTKGSTQEHLTEEYIPLDKIAEYKESEETTVTQTSTNPPENTDSYVQNSTDLTPLIYYAKTVVNTSCK